MRIALFVIFVSVCLTSCTSRKSILYIQDSEDIDDLNVEYASPTIQPNDILDIRVETLVTEAAIPYNKSSSSLTAPATTLDLLMLNGYLVSTDNMIKFPVLGEVSVQGMDTKMFEVHLKKLLQDGGHLVNPTVYVRILNSKVTVLGEVNAPGTYNFTEQSINVLQALGYAKDLTIKGIREDVMIIREKDGIRKIAHLNLTSSEILNSPYYTIQPNDIIIVNQNDPRVKNAGYIENIGMALTVASLLLSVTILLTR